MHAPTASGSPRISPLTVEPPTSVGARAVCPHCGGHLDTTTVVGRPDTTEPVVAAGPRTLGEAAALRSTLGRIVALMLEVIGGRRPAGQLASVADAPVRRYLRATRPVAPAATLVVRSVRVCVPVARVAELCAVVGYGRRVRTVAARFEQHDGGWRCVTFRLL